jgi:hypothetical protein
LPEFRTRFHRKTYNGRVGVWPRRSLPRAVRRTVLSSGRTSAKRAFIACGWDGGQSEDDVGSALNFSEPDLKVRHLERSRSLQAKRKISREAALHLVTREIPVRRTRSARLLRAGTRPADESVGLRNDAIVEPENSN